MIPADYFFWFLAGILGGIAFASYAAGSVAPLFVAAAGGTFLFIWTFRRKGRAFAVSLFLLGCTVGFVRMWAFPGSRAPVPQRISISALASVRDRFEFSLNRSLPEPEVSFASGIILGKVRKFPAALYHAMRTTSTLHLVAVSGYNITVIAVSILRFLEMLTAHRKLAWYIAVAGIILFTLFVGAPASAVRAALMGIVVLIGKRIGRSSDMRNALAFAAACMLLVNPLFFRFDLGFQLSFLATIGILYVSPLFAGGAGMKVKKEQTRLTYLKEILRDTVSAQAMVAPWILYKFGTISLVGVFANLFVLPIIPLAMLLSFLTGIGGLISYWTGIGAGLASLPILSYAMWVIKLFASLPFAAVSFSKPPLILTALAYALIAFFVVQKRKSLHSAYV